eukprot:PhM_4_TR3774/c0_g1_i2/m.59913
MNVNRTTRADAKRQQQQSAEIITTPQDQLDEAWRQAYIAQELASDPAQRIRTVPHRTLLEEFALEEARKRTKAVAERNVKLRNYLMHPVRQEALAKAHQRLARVVPSPQARWDLLRDVVCATKNDVAGAFGGADSKSKHLLSLYSVIDLATTSTSRVVRKVGRKPPIPDATPPPFRNEVVAFNDLVSYRDRLREYLDTEWIVDDNGELSDPEEEEEERRERQRARSMQALSPPPPIRSLDDEERELLTGRTKLDRARRYNQHVRATSTMGLYPTVKETSLDMSVVRPKTASNLRHEEITIDFSHMDIAELRDVYAREPRNQVRSEAKKDPLP